MRTLLFCWICICVGEGLSAQSYKTIAHIRDSIARKQDHKNALPYCEQAATLALEQYGDTSLQYIESLIMLSKGQAYVSKFQEAATHYPKIEALLAQTHRDSAEIAILYFNCRYLASFAKDQLEEAETWIRKAIYLSEKLNRGKDRNTIGYLNNLSSILTKRSKYQEAEQILLRCKKTFEEQGQQKHQFYSNFLGNLGIIYYMTGNYPEALKYYQAALNLSQEIGNVNRTIDLMHSIYLIYRRYPDKWIERRVLLGKILQGYQNSQGIYSIGYALALENRASLYLESKNPREALKDIREAKSIMDSIGAVKTNTYFLILSTAGNICMETGDTAQGRQYYKTGLDLAAELYGRSSERYYTELLHWTYFLMEVGEREPVIPNLLEIKTFFEANNLTSKSAYKRTLSYIQANYQYHGRFAEAGVILDTLYQRLKKEVGLHYSLLLDVIEAQINVYQNTGNKTKLFESLEELGRELNTQSMQEMYVLPEKDRLLYKDKIMHFNDKQLSIALHHKEVAKVASIYSQVFLRKSLVLNTALQIKKQIHTQGDSTSIQLYDQWESLKERLGYLYAFPPEKIKTYGYDLNQLAEQVETVERQLSIRSAPFKNLKEFPEKTWLDLRATLRSDEAMVDVVRFHQNYPEQDNTNQVQYAVFILRPDFPEPKLVFLQNSSDLNAFIYEQYINTIQAGKAPAPEIYRAFWGDIDPYLKGVKTLYIAPDGIFHKINLNTLRRTDGKFLAEVYDIRILHSMGEFLQAAPEMPATPCRAMLMGNPHFDLAISGLNAVTPESNNWRAILPDSTFTLKLLPESALEVNEIARLLSSYGCETENLLDTLATETRLKSVRSPRLLHLATHGHFLKSPKRERMMFDENETADNPMLRSMLFFAGASNTLREEVLPTGFGDGIFTAYEATNLNLEGTELVVLSACNTGLGKIENGEGVFGMQRAFRYAGARFVLMSLWEVEDKAARIFMHTFYQHWLLDKQDIPQAFRRTQLDLQKKMTPAQWGAFVLIGN